MPGPYTFNDYDQHLCLKVNAELWLIILYLLRPYLIWFSSLGLGGKRTGISTGVKGLREMIYPDDFSLMLGILATIPVMLCMYAWTKRKPGAKPLVKKLWQRGRLLLVTAAALNIVIIFVPLLTMVSHKLVFANWVQVGISVMIVWYLLFTQRVRDTFADFPGEKKTGDAE
jgi:hypothetical protein